MESKYSFTDMLFSVMKVVLFSVERQLAVKLNDGRVVNAINEKSEFTRYSFLTRAHMYIDIISLIFMCFSSLRSLTLLREFNGDAH